MGAITVSGLTFEDSRALIDTRIEQQLIGVEAVVTLGRLRAIGVFMAGEVRVPGAYSVSALTTVTQALFQAGGVTDIGSLRNIQVRRSGEIVTTFDTYDLLMSGDPSGDIRLQSGDVLFVPTIDSVVEVHGEVRRPMAYELSGGETVADLITMAGGFTKEAFGELAVLIRTSLEGGFPTAESVNLLDQRWRHSLYVMEISSKSHQQVIRWQMGSALKALSIALVPSGGVRVCVYQTLLVAQNETYCLSLILHTHSSSESKMSY